MCLLIRTLYKFNTVEAFERAVETVEQKWSNKLIRGRVIYNKAKKQLTWKNLQEELEKTKATNPVTIHAFMNCTKNTSAWNTSPVTALN